MSKLVKAKAKKAKFVRSPKLDPFHYHEALDRTDVVINIIQGTLIDHHVFQHKDNKDLKKKVEEAQDILSGVYQQLGHREYVISEGNSKIKKI